MDSRRLTSVLFGGGLLVAALPLACSVLVDFDDEGRPCGEGGDCLEDFTCMIDRCVANNSVPIGETCVENVHCIFGAVCVAAVCREECDPPFDSSECGPTQVCVPTVDRDGTAVAVCQDADCDDSSPCDNGGAGGDPLPIGGNRACVSVKGGVGYCRDSCGINCTPPGCDDGGNCIVWSDSRKLGACQPAGTEQTLACGPVGDRVQGGTCDYLDHFCDTSHACVVAQGEQSGLCAAHCDPAELPDPCSSLMDPWSSPAVAATCNLVPGGGFAVCGNPPG